MKKLFVAVLMLPLLLAASADRFASSIFPLEFMEGKPYGICENLPGVLYMNVWAKDAEAKRLFGNGRPVITVELPEFLTMTGACVKENEFDPLQRLPFSGKEIIRDGETYRRYEIEFRFFNNWNSSLNVGTPNPQNQFRLFLAARPGSAGKSGLIRWSGKFGTMSMAEATYPVRSLAAPPRPERPAQYFALAIPGANGNDTPYTASSRPMADFWTALSSRAFTYRGNFNADVPGWSGKFHHDYMIGCNKQLIVFSTREMIGANRRWRQMCADGKVPQLVRADGGVISNVIPAHYLVDDPDKLYDTYLRNGFRSIRKLYPQCRKIIFNYEPGADGYDHAGLARFAKVGKLSKTPTREEAVERYREQWFNYMLGVHQQYLAKVRQVLREEWPGVELWLCTDNLHAGGQAIAAWCAVDSRRAEAVVDGHMPMPYYCGTPFFDDLAFNLRELKKPLLPLIDPAERSWRFFSEYTPVKVRQNIIAAAALGAQGIGFWPDDTLSGEYFQVFGDAMSRIAVAERFYRHRRRADGKVKLTVKNAVDIQLRGRNGELAKVAFPDYSAFMRTLVHEDDGELLVTLFNYHSEEPLFIELRSEVPAAAVSEIGGVRYPGADLRRGVLIKLKPLDVKLIRLGKSSGSGAAADTKAIQTELRTAMSKLKSGNHFQEINRPGASLCWQPRGLNRVPTLIMKNLHGEVTVDAMKSSEALHWPGALTPGYLGRFMLYDQQRIPGPYPFALQKLTAEKSVPAAVFAYGFKARDAASYALHGLTVEKSLRMLVNTPELETSFTVRNPTAQNMRLGFRVANLPFSDTVSAASGSFRIDKNSPVNSIYAKAGFQSTFLSHLKRHEWDGSRITVRSAKNVLHLDAGDFSGVYFWVGDGRMTVEFLTPDFDLAPGASRTFRCKARYW